MYFNSTTCFSGRQNTISGSVSVITFETAWVVTIRIWAQEMKDVIKI